MSITANTASLQSLLEAVRTLSEVRGLPAVTTADNGKFLRVVDGVWVATTMDNAEGASF